MLPWVVSIRLVLSLLDPLAVVLAGLLVLSDPEPITLVGASVAALLVCRGAGLHRSRLVLGILEDLPALLAATAAATAGVLLVGPDPGSPVEGGWVTVLAFAALSFTTMVLLRTATYAATRLLRRSRRVARPILVVGVGAVGRRLADALGTRRELGLVPVGMLDCGDADDLRGLPLPLVGDLDDLDEAMRELGVRDVVFAFPRPPDEDTLAAVRRSVEAGHQVLVVPRFYEIMGRDHHRRTELVRDIAVMRLQRRDLRTRAVVARRFVDVVVASCGLVVLAPVLALIALAVRLEIGPGVIFHQTRVGERGRTFTLLKFTTLRPVDFGADATTWSIDNDSRIGPVGQLLRRTGLDELPQLVNVLRGELSLVGPRPDRPAPVAHFPPGRGAGTDRTPEQAPEQPVGRDERVALSAPDESRPGAGRSVPDPELMSSRRG